MIPNQDSPAHPPSPAPAAEGVLAFPASIAQQMFWYLELLQGEVTAFNVPLRFRLSGPLDPSLLEQSINHIIDRHEALRTRFDEADGELLQIVMPELKLSIPLTDLSHLPTPAVDEEAERLGSIEARRPFHLSTGPLIRAELLRLAPTSHILHVSIHHSIFDGMSMTVLTREIAIIYQALFDQEPTPLDPLPIQFGDYSVWQKDFLNGPEMRRQLDFWKSKLHGMTELDLPTEFPRPPVKSWKGEITSILLPKELTDRLQSIAASHGATLFHLQLAAYFILLHRYTGSLDIAVGTPVTGRTSDDLEPLIGVFINSLILRCDLSGNPVFSNLLTRVRDTALEALENQELPFEYLVRALRPERDQSRNPLFQVNFNHHRSFARAGTFGGVTLTPIPSRSPGTIFDLHFFMVERKEGWRASCDYSTDLFSRTAADRMLGHYKHLLEDIAAFPEKPLSDFEILTNPETEQLSAWARDPRPYPSDATIGTLFLETASRFPTRTALVSNDLTISYQQLRNNASHLALALINDGVKPGDPVAISSAPTPEMIIGFLAILLAGGCCVPIDPTFPAERFNWLLENCAARFALASPAAKGTFPESWSGTLRVIPPATTAPPESTLPAVAVTADHPAHLLFTSGSTGQPKGVLLAHRGPIRLVRNTNCIPITEHDVFLQTAPASFDASLLEIWAPLLNGGRLILLPDGPALDSIAAAVRNHGVTTLWLTSGLFQLMVDEHATSLTKVRYILTGGELISNNHVTRALDALPHTQLINCYGPTENSIFTSSHPITRADLEKPLIPIGRPVANTTIHLLDEHLRPVPIGIPGELCTGGDGLAIGYLNAPELTAEKFVHHPQLGRIYRSGDLCRRTADGNIEFIGRRDHQVKVRGYRIELGEIESTLTAHPQVALARATVRGNTTETKRILAWIVPTPGTDPPTAQDLTTYLSNSLPAFMRPDGIAVIDAFPLNANGKIHLAALPDPGHSTRSYPARPPEPPSGPVESHLATIWSDLLGVPQINRHDDFFALGGHSLMALRMFSRINRELNKSMPLAILLQNPTLAQLASVIAPQEQSTPSTVPAPPTGKGHIVTLNRGASQVPLFCVHGGDGGVIFYRELANLLPKEIPFHAIESLELGHSGPLQHSSIEETAACYVRSILSIQSHGPFRLAGYSFGGVVAHEMACQLSAAGHSIEFLGLFDTHNPAAPARRYSLSERLNVFWRQNPHLPLPQRIAQLRNRVREGIATNRRVAEETSTALSSPPGEPYSDLRRVQVRELNWKMMQAYQPKPFNGRITLFKSSHLNDKIERPSDYGWSSLAISGLDIIPVTGNHLALFSPDHVGHLAQALVRSIGQSSPHPPDHDSPP